MRLDNLVVLDAGQQPGFHPPAADDFGQGGWVVLRQYVAGCFSRPMRYSRTLWARRTPRKPTAGCCARVGHRIVGHGSWPRHCAKGINVQRFRKSCSCFRNDPIQFWVPGFHHLFTGLLLHYLRIFQIYDSCSLISKPFWMTMRMIISEGPAAASNSKSPPVARPDKSTASG